MTNYEKIKQMSVEEMAKFLNEIEACGVCVFDVDCFDCSTDEDNCSIGIETWLEQEAEE